MLTHKCTWVSSVLGSVRLLSWIMADLCLIRHYSLHGTRLIRCPRSLINITIWSSWAGCFPMTPKTGKRNRASLNIRAFYSPPAVFSLAPPPPSLKKQTSRRPPAALSHSAAPAVGKWQKLRELSRPVARRKECVSHPACSVLTAQHLPDPPHTAPGPGLPVDRAEVVLSVRGEQLLHGGRVAVSRAAGDSWGSPGEKFAERHRSTALIAIFTPCVCVWRPFNPAHTTLDRGSAHHPTVRGIAPGGRVRRGRRVSSSVCVCVCLKFKYLRKIRLLHLFIITNDQSYIKIYLCDFVITCYAHISFISFCFIVFFFCLFLFFYIIRLKSMLMYLHYQEKSMWMFLLFDILLCSHLL